MPFFAKNAQIVDVHGKRWNCDEIAKNFETLFVPYAKKNASYTIEETLIDSNNQAGRSGALEERSGCQYGAGLDAPNDRCSCAGQR